MAIHVVTSGEALWLISQTYRLPISMIKELNGLDSDILTPGLALYIPEQLPPERFYTIKPGDNLWSLARRFNTTIEAILQANPGVIPTSLYIGQVITIPTLLKYPAQTLAFVDAFIPTSITELLNKYSTNLTYIAIFTYSARPDGALVDPDDASFIQEIKFHNIKPLMVISNYENGSFSPEIAQQVLLPNVRAKLIQNIVRKLSEKGYSGISLDFEAIPANQRDNFTAFVRELKAAMGNLILQINVFSKTRDMPNNPFAGAFDYAALGNIADIITVLTYDYGYTVGPPDPVAPVWWVSQILTYAASLIPKNKLMMAIPLYGYEWELPDTPETKADLIGVNIAQNQALGNLSPIEFNTIAEAPFYTYYKNRKQHIVWFEDIRSIRSKYRLMETYELLGVAYWRLRYDFPQNWAYVSANIDVMKT